MPDCNVSHLIIPFFNEAKHRELQRELDQLRNPPQSHQPGMVREEAVELNNLQSRITQIEEEIHGLHLPPDGPGCLHSGFGI
jgi:hypothetical protein